MPYDSPRRTRLQAGDLARIAMLAQTPLAGRIRRRGVRGGRARRGGLSLRSLPGQALGAAKYAAQKALGAAKTAYTDVVAPSARFAAQVFHDVGPYANTLAHVFAHEDKGVANLLEKYDKAAKYLPESPYRRGRGGASLRDIFTVGARAAHDLVKGLPHVIGVARTYAPYIGRTAQSFSRAYGHGGRISRSGIQSKMTRRGGFTLRDIVNSARSVSGYGMMRAPPAPHMVRGHYVAPHLSHNGRTGLVEHVKGHYVRPHMAAGLTLRDVVNSAARTARRVSGYGLLAPAGGRASPRPHMVRGHFSHNGRTGQLEYVRPHMAAGLSHLANYPLLQRPAMAAMGGRMRRRTARGGFSFGDFIGGIKDVGSKAFSTVGDIAHTVGPLAPLLPLVLAAGMKKRRRGGSEIQSVIAQVRPRNRLGEFLPGPTGLGMVRRRR